MKILGWIVVGLFAGMLQGKGQSVLNAKTLFVDDSVLQVTLSTDVKTLVKEKVSTNNQKGVFAVMMPDSTVLSEEIKVRARGAMRRKTCNFPPLKLSFDNTSLPESKSLKSLKFVKSCRGTSFDEQLLIKEYLIYKMYNVLTELSFRVRLLNLTLQDSEGKMKTEKGFAFLVEDVDVMAKRNGCKEMSEVKINSESTDREQMTLVALFQYMIGNTDWSVPNNHNIKLILPKNKLDAKPLVVPYDFDFAGFVDADYAVPDEMMEILDVKDRRYRGFPRSMEELQTAIQLFNRQKDSIYAVVNNCEPLNAGNKKKAIKYLDAFFEIINNEKSVQREFIDNARLK